MVSDRALKQSYVLLFAPLALQTSFATLYFERRGLSHGEIGLVSAVAGFAGVIATLFWGHVGDRVERKRLLQVALAVGSAVGFASLWWGGSLGPLMGLFLFFSFCRSPLIPLGDAYCLDALAARGDRDAVRYSRIRMWGSIGFIATSFGAKWLVLKDPAHNSVERLAPVFAAYGIIALLHAARTFALPDVPRAAGAPKARKRDLVRVAALPGVGFFMLVMLVSTAAHSGYYLYLSLYLESIGVADDWVGAYWGVAVIAEVVILAFGTPLLARFGVRRLLLAGILGRAVRQLAYSWPLHPLVVLFIQPLHALAFGASHVGSIAYLARTVPQHLRATGQAVLYAMSYGFGGIVGNALAGWLSDEATAGGLRWLTARTGLYATFWLTGWLQVATLVAALVWLREPPASAASLPAGPSPSEEAGT